MRALASATIALAALLSAAAPATPQYFGRNKVQVERFDFRVLPTTHFDIYYYPSEYDAALAAGRMAERWYDRLSVALAHSLTERPPIVLYASHAHFTQTTVISALLSDGIGGFTDHDRGRVVLPFAAGLAETNHVLGHELVHAFQRDILKRAGRSLALLPLWFSEGMAEYLAVGAVDTNTAMWLRDAVDHDALPTIAQLDNPKWFPYRYGQALWAYLSGRFGQDIAARAMASTAKGGAVGRLAAVTGVDGAELSRRWQAALRETYGRNGGEALHHDVDDVLVGKGRHEGRVNVGPSLSPDGSRLVFLSERDGYSIDVFLADAASGIVIRKLVSTATDPHFDSLQFLESAGAWNAAGTQFAFATLQRGRPVLTILEMPSGVVARERRFDDLDQMFSPTWSPDGRRIAFSAMRGGTTDLYAYDFDCDTVDRLTSDAYADLQPAWSPDGATIAFVTDRFTSSLDGLTFGDYRLAALDVPSGAVRPLPFLAGAKNIDPHWANGTLYFVGDAGGVSNVYSLDVASGSIARVTDVREGVSGLTALSPALSVASRADRLAFSEYGAGQYDIHVTRRSTLAQEAVVARPFQSRDGVEQESAVARPSQGREGTTDGTPIADVSAPAEPAPWLSTHDSRPYRRKLSLSGLGQPYVAAGGGALGSYFRAGMSAAFSDLLEDQQVATAIQFGTALDELAVETAYVNRQSRWNWGIVGSQAPILIGNSRLLASDAAATTPTITRETEVLRQMHRTLTGVLMYPFSASTRFEVAGGLHAISFNREIATEVYSRAGSLLGEGDETRPVAPTLTLFDFSSALVHDTAVFGSTAPVLGTRSRLEFAPTAGGLSMVTLTADYRKYVMPVRPFTLAFRIQHVGRYGDGAGDPRLLPLVWNLRDLVRGYDALGVLSTVRMAIVNAELRVPLVGPFGRFSGATALPVDGILFADGGAFWSARTPSLVASLASGEVSSARSELRSIGAGIRLNAGGFVFEFDGVRTLDQQPRGWTFAVNFRPGF